MTAARSAGIPAINERLLDLGSDGASKHAAGGLGPLLWYGQPLHAEEARVLARMTRAPRWQEVA